MTADVELLPLYAELQGHPKIEIIKHYARANVEHHTAAKDAEIEALRAKTAMTMGVGSGDGKLFVHGDYESIKAAQEIVLRAERLAEALHRLEEACDDSDGAQYGTLGTSFVRGICKDALLHDQEEGK